MDCTSSFYSGLYCCKKDSSFKNAVSGTFGEFSFNREFVSRGLERRAQGHKKHPQKMFGSPPETLKDLKEICKGSGFPRDPQQFTDATPSKLVQTAIKKEVCNIFQMVVKSTITIKLTKTYLNMGIGGESILSQLPN
jgi:hypothetical protein